MVGRRAADGAGGLFLGETRITGPWLHGIDIRVGEEVMLRLQPNDQAFDDCPIEVLRADGETLARLSRRVAAWLAPLLDGGIVRAEAIISSPPARDDQGRRQGAELTLLVFLNDCGRARVLEDRALADERDIAHALVLWAWRQAHGGLMPDALKAVFTRVRLALPKRLHPETQLLLAMQPSLVEETVRTEAFLATAGPRRPPDEAAVGRKPCGNDSDGRGSTAQRGNHPKKGSHSCSR